MYIGSNALSAYILNVHISDHQSVILFTDGDLPHKKLKYKTIKTNSEEAKKTFVLFIQKQKYNGSTG